MYSRISVMLIHLCLYHAPLRYEHDCEGKVYTPVLLKVLCYISLDGADVPKLYVCRDLQLGPS
jgi:hypothetical protein